MQFQRFSRFLGSNFVKKIFFQKVHDLVLIYTPKEAHSRIFVTGGSVIAWQMLAKKKYYSWGGQLVLIYADLCYPVICIQQGEGYSNLPYVFRVPEAVQACRPKKGFFCAPLLWREYWPLGHENPATGLLLWCRSAQDRVSDKFCFLLSPVRIEHTFVEPCENRTHFLALWE